MVLSDLEKTDKTTEHTIREFLSGDLRKEMLNLLATASTDGTDVFAALFELGAIGCTIACVGFALGFRKRREPLPEASGPLPRSALIMPIYEEDAEHTAIKHMEHTERRSTERRPVTAARRGAR